jgi:hypothetical protein
MSNVRQCIGRREFLGAAAAGTVLSHDAYLQFIEDLFLKSARGGVTSDGTGTMDERSITTIRENSTNLGNLLAEFEFGSGAQSSLLVGDPVNGAEATSSPPYIKIWSATMACVSPQ